MIYQYTVLILVVPVHITVNFVFQFSFGYLCLLSLPGQLLRFNLRLPMHSFGSLGINS